MWRVTTCQQTLSTSRSTALLFVCHFLISECSWVLRDFVCVVFQMTSQERDFVRSTHCNMATERMCGIGTLFECGNVGAVGPGTGGSVPTAWRSSEIGNWCPASRSSNDNDIHRASGSARYAGRDTEWSEWSFILKSVAYVANLEPAMEGAFSGPADQPVAELTLMMKLSAKQLSYLIVNTVRVKASTLVRSAEKHHGVEAWKRIKTEYQPEAARTAYSNAQGYRATW